MYLKLMQSLIILLSLLLKPRRLYCFKFVCPSAFVLQVDMDATTADSGLKILFTSSPNIILDKACGY